MVVGFEGFLVTLVATYGVAAAVGLLAGSRSAFGLVASALGSALGGLLGLIIGGQGVMAALGAGGLDRVGRLAGLGPLALSPYTSVSFRLDGLSAFFLALIGGGMLLASLYAVGYLRPVHSPSPRLIAVCLPLFGLAMSLVPLANDAFTFLLLWETMSLASYCLVVEHHADEHVRSAGFVYLVMTHCGTAFILVAFLLLGGPAASLDFEAMRTAAGALPGPTRAAVFLAALLGFGTKAGLVPLHVWLPRAHPVAPSHVSALMSGVMIKLGIYGLVRVGWEMLGVGPAWWGGLLMLVGAVSAVVGVLYAYVEADLKRLLAFSTIENAGLIALALGGALVARASGHDHLAAYALATALLHTLNHALFKTLLFCGAGAVLRATGTRHLDRLGGLMRPMPWTGGLMLAGFMALGAVPPLNGFASEWALVQVLIGLATSAGGLMPALVAMAVAAVALSGALALATGVKALGVGFLGVPRKERPVPAEASPWMVFVMVVLAAGCIGLGLVPGLGWNVVGGGAPLPVFLPGPGTAAAGIAPALVTLALLLGAAAASLLARLAWGPAATRQSAPWFCGGTLTPRMQYTSASFSKPILLIFRSIIRPVRIVERTYQAADSAFVDVIRYRRETHPLAERFVYRTVRDRLLSIARTAHVIQSGSTRLYLTYIFATLVLLLVLSRW